MIIDCQCLVALLNGNQFSLVELPGGLAHLGRVFQLFAESNILSRVVGLFRVFHVDQNTVQLVGQVIRIHPSTLIHGTKLSGWSE